MAITRVHAGEGGPLRPGDAVFGVDPEDEELALHVGIYVGPEIGGAGGETALRVRGLPCTPSNPALGESSWNTAGCWRLVVVGYRRDVDPAQLKEVILLAERVAAEHSPLGTTCGFHTKSIVRAAPSGFPLFVAGSCSHFVEYLYELAGLDLVDQQQTFDPKHRERLYPSTQIRAFWSERYPLLEQPWRDALARYPDCIEQGPGTTGASGSQ